MRYLCEFLFIVWVTSSDNILRFLAISNFLNQQTGRGNLSVRKMNLRSHETSISIVTQSICTGIFKSILKPFSAKHFKRSILSYIHECKIFNRKKVALIITLKLKNYTNRIPMHFNFLYHLHTLSYCCKFLEIKQK